MDVKVHTEDNKDYEDVHGGAYATNDVHIYVNKELPLRVQRNNVLHEVIECFCCPWPHEKVEELADLISDALDQLEG